MDIIITFIILAILRQIAAIVGIFRTVFFLKNGGDKVNKIIGSNINLPHIFLVISVLREQKIISNTIKYFLSLAYPSFDLLIVTSERENNESKEGEITTVDILKELKEQHSFIWFHLK
jgi:hypothetical protein